MSIVKAFKSSTNKRLTGVYYYTAIHENECEIWYKVLAISFKDESFVNYLYLDDIADIRVLIKNVLYRN